MKVQYKTANGRLTFELESESDKKLVANLAHIQEIFEEPACGCCKSDKIRFEVREFDGNSYYKLLCEACGATLDFGQNKVGDTLFVKRLEKDTRNPLPNAGWYRYKDKPAAGTPKPASAPAMSHTTKAPAQAAKPAAPKPPAPPPPLDQRHAQLLTGFDGAQTEENLRAWARWGKQFPFTELQQGEAEDRFHDALERIALAQSPTRRPARASA